MSTDTLSVRSAPNSLGYREVTAETAASALGTIRVIDVREPDEYTGPLGHIPGSELVPLATIPTAAAGWSRAAPLLVACRSGVRSGRAAAVLAQMGFTVYNLSGGMLAWSAEGRTVEGPAV